MVMCWNWMKPGRLFIVRRTSGGYGPPCVGEHVKSLLLQSVTIAMKRVSNYGITYPMTIKNATRLVTFGTHTNLLFPKKPIGRWAKKQEKQPIWNDGITP